MSGFNLEEFGKRGNKTPSRSFPLKVVSYGLNRGTGLADTVTGIDLSAENKPTVTVFLRPRKVSENGEASGTGFARPEVVNFATDVLGAAMTANDRRKIEAAMNDPLAKVFTEVGGVLLVDGAYLDEESKMWSASWLKSLAKTPGSVEVLVPVMARLNDPYLPKGGVRMAASMDLVYPEKLVTATSFADLEQFAIETMRRSSSGTPFVVLRLIDTGSGEIFARMIRPGTKLVDGDYVQDQPADVIKRFWGSFPPDWMANLRAEVDAGNIKAEIFPGVRYYFVGKGLEAAAKDGEKRTARFHMAKGEDNGFLASTVVLKAHEGVPDEMFPIGCFPLLPFDSQPVGLASV